MSVIQPSAHWQPALMSFSQPIAHWEIWEVFSCVPPILLIVWVVVQMRLNLPQPREQRTVAIAVATYCLLEFPLTLAKCWDSDSAQIACMVVGYFCNTVALFGATAYTHTISQTSWNIVFLKRKPFPSWLWFVEVILVRFLFVVGLLLIMVFAFTGDLWFFLVIELTYYAIVYLTSLQIGYCFVVIVYNLRSSRRLSNKCCCVPLNLTLYVCVVTVCVAVISWLLPGTFSTTSLGSGTTGTLLSDNVNSFHGTRGPIIFRAVRSLWGVLLLKTNLTAKPRNSPAIAATNLLASTKARERLGAAFTSGPGTNISTSSHTFSVPIPIPTLVQGQSNLPTNTLTLFQPSTFFLGDSQAAGHVFEPNDKVSRVLGVEIADSNTFVHMPNPGRWHETGDKYEQPVARMCASKSSSPSQPPRTSASFVNSPAGNATARGTICTPPPADTQVYVRPKEHTSHTGYDSSSVSLKIDIPRTPSRTFEVHFSSLSPAAGQGSPLTDSPKTVNIILVGTYDVSVTDVD